VRVFPRSGSEQSVTGRMLASVLCELIGVVPRGTVALDPIHDQCEVLTMSIPKRTTASSLALLLATLIQAQAAPPQDPGSSKSWKPLYDGHSLDGWDHVGPGKFVIEDGVLRTQGGMGLLWYTREKLGDCVIRVVYKTGTPRSNSGIYIRIAEGPKDPWYAVHHGFEVQIMDNGPVDRRTGSIYTFSKATAQPAKSGDWNTLEITLKGNQVQTAINGVAVAEFDSSDLKPEPTDTNGEGDPARGPRPPSGYIGLQNHDESSVVFFKEVSVRPLSSGGR
jgi:Domain of Unknown Function (DUF1080)